MSWRRRFSVAYCLAVVAIFFALLFVLTNCGTGQDSEGGGEAQSLSVAVLPLDSSAHVAYARELGLFEKNNLNLKLQKLASGAAIVSAVTSGEADVGYSNVVSIATAYDKGLPLTVVAPAGLYSSAEPQTALIVARDSQIQSGEDLNGKTFGVNGINNITQVGAMGWIDQHGGDSSTVKFVELGFSNMVEAVAQGRIDAGFVPEPFVAQARENDEVRILAGGYDGIDDDFLTTAWFSTRTWTDENPEKARKFAQIMQEAARWGNEHPEKALPILADYTGISPEVLDSMNRAELAEASDPTMAQPPIDVAVKYGIVEKPLDANKLWYQQ